MKNDRFMWLVIEPYIHGVVKKNDVLLYNTVNKLYIVYRESPEIAEIMRQLLDSQNGYVVRLSAEKLASPVVRRFIAELRKKFMGDLHDPQWSQSKPFNIFPGPVIKRAKNTLENHLREITFHLNTTDHPDLKPFKEAYRQFPFPKYTAGSCQTLSLEIIQTIAVQIKSLPFATINFVGTGLFEKQLFGQLTAIFKDSPFKRKFHVPLNQLMFPTDMRLGKLDQLCLYITFPLAQAQLDFLHSVSIKNAKNSRIECNFVVRDSLEVEKAMEIIAGMSFGQTFFKPFMNGKNMQFFREHVFISEEDIRASRPTQNQIFSRLTMNENDYGKLTVLPGGDVYANLNDELLGNTSHQTIIDLVEKEVAGGKSWMRRRPLMEPCTGCLYQFLCPPISNYEIRLQQYNFCHIWPH